jgi:tellurite resistance protein
MEIKLLHLKNLVMIAMADGVLDPMEREFILEKASLLEISKKDLNIIFKDAEEMKNSLKQNTLDRDEQLADAALMAVIDGDIHKNEVKVIRDLGRILGFTDEYIDEILQKSYNLWNRSSK